MDGRSGKGERGRNVPRARNRSSEGMHIALRRRTVTGGVPSQPGTHMAPKRIQLKGARVRRTVEQLPENGHLARLSTWRRSAPSTVGEWCYVSLLRFLPLRHGAVRPSQFRFACSRRGTVSHPDLSRKVTGAYRDARTKRQVRSRRRRLQVLFEEGTVARAYKTSTCVTGTHRPSAQPKVAEP